MYSLQDKPWVYAHLLEIQRKLGRENFPLIEQSFYPTHKDMVGKQNLENIELIRIKMCFRNTKARTPVSLKLATLTGVSAKFVLRLQEVFK